jgi:hypothetical protein
MGGSREGREERRTHQVKVKPLEFLKNDFIGIPKESEDHLI